MAMLVLYGGYNGIVWWQVVYFMLTSYSLETGPITGLVKIQVSCWLTSSRLFANQVLTTGGRALGISRLTQPPSGPGALTQLSFEKWS